MIESADDAVGYMVGPEMENRNVERLTDSFGFMERDELITRLFGATTREQLISSYQRRLEWRARQEGHRVRRRI